MKKRSRVEKEDGFSLGSLSGKSRSVCDDTCHLSDVRRVGQSPFPEERISLGRFSTTVLENFSRQTASPLFKERHYFVG